MTPKALSREELTNYVQTGDGHCWICHKSFFANHMCTLETTFPTECTQEKCGRWFTARYKLIKENK